jgi:hypothetical protein
MHRYLCFVLLCFVSVLGLKLGLHTCLAIVLPLEPHTSPKLDVLSYYDIDGCFQSVTEPLPKGQNRTKGNSQITSSMWYIL